MKHGVQQDRICPWCLRTFFDRRAVDTHALAKHKRSFAKSEDWQQRARLQRYHQDRAVKGPGA